MPHRNLDDTWTADALENGDIASVMKRVLSDPDYLSSRDVVGSTPLLTAVGYNATRLVEFMLGHGADPDPPVDDGYTTLLTAIESEHPASLEIVSRLIEAGADIHRTGMSGNTPLHMAAARGHVEKARLLIAAGADVNRRKEIDAEETPLMEAAHQGRSEMVKLLLESGADPTMRDTILDRTPLEIAQCAAKGADPDVIAYLKSSDYADLLAILDERVESSFMLEQYRNAADRCVREGDHEGVIRMLGLWNIERRSN